MKSHILAKMLLAHPNVDVMVACDPEGNQFESLDGVEFDNLLQIGRCENNVYAKHWSADDAGMSEEDWQEFKKDAPEVVVLWPL